MQRKSWKKASRSWTQFCFPWRNVKPSWRRWSRGSRGQSRAGPKDFWKTWSRRSRSQRLGRLSSSSSFVARTTFTFYKASPPSQPNPRALRTGTTSPSTPSCVWGLWGVCSLHMMSETEGDDGCWVYKSYTLWWGCEFGSPYCTAQPGCVQEWERGPQSGRDVNITRQPRKVWYSSFCPLETDVRLRKSLLGSASGGKDGLVFGSGHSVYLQEEEEHTAPKKWSLGPASKKRRVPKLWMTFLSSLVWIQGWKKLVCMWTMKRDRSPSTTWRPDRLCSLSQGTPSLRNSVCSWIHKLVPMILSPFSQNLF